MADLLYKHEEQEEESSNELKHRFDALRSTPIKKSVDFRIVNLRLIVGCGCGGGASWIHAIVPNNKHFGFDEGDKVDSDDLRSAKRDGIKFKDGKYYGDADDYDESRYSSI